MSSFFDKAINRVRGGFSRITKKKSGSEYAAVSGQAVARTEAASPQEQEMLERARNRYYTKISGYLFYILSFIVCYEAAAYFWYKIPSVNSSLAGLSAAELKAIREQNRNIDVTALPLFGVRPVENSQASQAGNQQPSGPVSKLDVKITGISASNDPQKGSVAVINKSHEESYGVGDKIEGTQAVVSQILADRIIVKNGGRDETIIMPADNYQSSDQRPSGDFQKTKPENHAAAKSDVKQVRTELLSNPGNLFKYLSIKPAMKDGKPAGYELNPGSEGKMFLDAGLKPGDIAVEMNGYDLTDTNQAMQVMGQIQDMTEITLVVDRNGDRQTVTLNLN
ncbi:type II secretion system protein GspC [Succinimonas amylolytica]|uniref:type II secretion system protein GspC n=1 Tax=Succinimonas amylolytica TaxID=83769 RepID=UPI00037BCCAD|nr:type II secretion system protein GspC [Succinimonas amylolytica]